MFSGLQTICIGFAAAAALAVAADTAADLVFAKVRADIVADIADSRGVACMESVERTRYAARKPAGNATCGELVAITTDTPRGTPVWHSRLRLNVTAGVVSEEFALTDASRFERNDVGGMLRAAAAGSGEFSMFLHNLIAGDGDPFESRGLQQTAIGKLLAFGFTVPAEKSHLLYASFASGNTTEAVRAAYRGSLLAVPESRDLKRLTIEAENAGDACRVQYATDYAATRVGDREILLPQSSRMEVVYRDGTELGSETYYSGCHRPAARTVAATAAADSPKPLPPNVRFRIRFQPAINSETAATGDPVTGVIRDTVKDKQKGIIVHAGDRVHGRIAVIEQYLSPGIRWNLAIVFETIERGVGEHGIDQGVEQPVSLVPIDDGERSTRDESMSPAELERLRPPGGGLIIFHDPTALLDPKFETVWETR